MLFFGCIVNDELSFLTVFWVIYGVILVNEHEQVWDWSKMPNLNVKTTSFNLRHWYLFIPIWSLIFRIWSDVFSDQEPTMALTLSVNTCCQGQLQRFFKKVEICNVNSDVVVVKKSYSGRHSEKRRTRWPDHHLPSSAIVNTFVVSSQSITQFFCHFLSIMMFRSGAQNYKGDAITTFNSANMEMYLALPTSYWHCKKVRYFVWVIQNFGKRCFEKVFTF